MFLGRNDSFVLWKARYESYPNSYTRAAFPEKGGLQKGLARKGSKIASEPHANTNTYEPLFYEKSNSEDISK